MKKLKIVFPLLALFLVSAFFISSCSKDNPASPPYYGEQYKIRVSDYSDAHYFFDTLYKASFVDYFNNTTGVLRPETEAYRVLSEHSESFEVWVQTDITTIDKRYAAAITMLHAQPPFGYPNNYKTFPQTEGIVFNGYFRKLNSNEYVVYPYGGFISLKINLHDNIAVGVTYRTAIDSLYGTPSSIVSGNDTLILKMIKCINTNPTTTPLAWELKMKNIYRLPFENIRQDGFWMIITRMHPYGLYGTWRHGSKSSLTIVDLDRYTGSTRISPPDDRFDFLPGYTINPETGDVIFPSLRPFWDKLIMQGMDSTNYFPEIYTMTKLDVINSPNAGKYMLEGSVMP